jgi:peptidoglycan-N-acetylglucosamine deacetylase
MRAALRSALLAAVMATGVIGAEPAGRTVAVTFDDLPGPSAGLVSNDISALRENTARLLASFREHGVPVIGFVNEGKLFVDGETAQDVASRTAILKMWVDAGLELGNHTYSHVSLNKTPLDEFEADVIRGETVTRRLLAETGKTLRYFRHPFLHVGLDLQKRRAFEAFLKAKGYTVAPVTIANDDYVYAEVYADALRRGDRAFASRVGADYVRYMKSAVAFAEGVSQALTGREISQTLLLHANALNADFFGEVAGFLKARGYRFVTLGSALQDEAYRHADTYVGDWGISWLHHWELSDGRQRSTFTDPPDWIRKADKDSSR